jgi:hypothetical protein
MYAIAAACVLLAGFVGVIVDSIRSRTYRWAIIGIIAGLACWSAPLIQQFSARTGNMTQLIDTLRAGSTARAGRSFGLKALSAATQPPTYWWKLPLPPLKLSTIDQRAAWFGVVELAVTALVLIIAICAPVAPGCRAGYFEPPDRRRGTGNILRHSRVEPPDSASRLELPDGAHVSDGCACLARRGLCSRSLDLANQALATYA